MAQKALQAMGGVLNSDSLSALEGNFNDLYAYYGVAGGNPFSTNRFVDGDNGADANDGKTPTTAFKTIQAAIDASAQGDRIFIKPLEADTASGDTDPDAYAENLTITAKDGLQLIGVSRGCAYGSQPVIKKGSGTSAQITINSFGVGIHNLTINGSGATGGGIKLVANGSTYDAGGAVISGCHFRNCKGSAAAATGGAIYWTSSGGCWHVLIQNNDFWDCRAGIVVIGTGVSVPKGVKILHNFFGSTVKTNVDADIYAAGDGFVDCLIANNDFATIGVPAYATSPDAARYIKLLGGSGLITRNTFAVLTDVTGSELKFGATGDGAIVPTTYLMAGNWGEGQVATSHLALVGRT